LVNPFQYTARESDTETGLYYYRARYYDQSNGRFISEDPIEFDGGKNFYAYVENEPTGFIDPRGLDDTPGWPIPGSATPFPPKGGPAPRRKPNNCLAYALGKRDQWMQPDRSPADYGLIPYMKQHGCAEVPCDADCWAPFLVAGSLIQDQPDQTTLSMRNDPDGLIMSEARDATAIDDFEDASFEFYGGVSRLIE